MMILSQKSLKSCRHSNSSYKEAVIRAGENFNNTVTREILMTDGQSQREKDNKFLSTISIFIGISIQYVGISV